MKFKVGDKVTVSDSELKATNKKYNINKSMFKILEMPYCTVKNISGGGAMELEEIGWIWHADDFELYGKRTIHDGVTTYNLEDLEPGDLIKVFNTCYLNGDVNSESVLEYIGNGEYDRRFKFISNPVIPSYVGSTWWIADDHLKNHLESRNITIIKQLRTSESESQTGTLKEKLNKIKKGSKKTMAAPYSTTEKLQYSKLSKENKEFYKAGFVDLYGDLTDDGKNFIDAYLRDKYKDEALKSILTTVKAVNEETKGDE